MVAKSKEQWKEIPFPKNALRKRYAVSSAGRIASFEDKMEKGSLLKSHLNKGYEAISLKPFGGYKSLLVHRAVAEAFIKKPSRRHQYVLHLDFDKTNNSLSNLKWATKEEQKEHEKKSPFVIQSRLQRTTVGVFSKVLTEAKVKQLKSKMWNPKRKSTLKSLAEQFGISEMNLYRIKKGEFWYHVKVDGEPDHPKYLDYAKKLKGQRKKA